MDSASHAAGEEGLAFCDVNSVEVGASINLQAGLLAMEPDCRGGRRGSETQSGSGALDEVGDRDFSVGFSCSCLLPFFQLFF